MTTMTISTDDVMRERMARISVQHFLDAMAAANPTDSASRALRKKAVADRRRRLALARTN